MPPVAWITVGMIPLVLAGAQMARWAGLEVMAWLWERSAVALVLVLPVPFAPELRRAIDRVSRRR